MSAPDLAYQHASWLLLGSSRNFKQSGVVPQRLRLLTVDPVFFEILNTLVPVIFDVHKVFKLYYSYIFLAPFFSSCVGVRENSDPAHFDQSNGTELIDEVTLRGV